MIQIGEFILVGTSKNTEVKSTNELVYNNPFKKFEYNISKGENTNLYEFTFTYNLIDSREQIFDITDNYLYEIKNYPEKVNKESMIEFFLINIMTTLSNFKENFDKEFKPIDNEITKEYLREKIG